MAMSRSYSLIGDSNVQRNVSKTTCRNNPLLKSAQIIPCGHSGIFVEALNSVRAESDVCIVACLTNFFTSTSGENSSSVSTRIEPILVLIHDALHAACAANPSRNYVLSAPMYRMTPLWYRDRLPEILVSYSQSLSQDRPPNLHLMSSFTNPDFVQDGVHLTPFSGLEYLNHLFDGAEAVLERLTSSPELVVLQQCESNRLLEDRVLVLEQDHRRLNQVIENKTAVDAELADWRENERNEDCFMIEGLPLIPSDVVGKEWQELARKHVKGVIVPLMGRDMEIVVVQNATGRYKDAPIKYCVKMASINDSKAIRRKFGSFFIGGDKRPEQFKPFSIRNRITPETKVRIELLKILGKHYKDSNPGSHIKVIGHDPRPLLKITPSSSASDRRVKTFNFIEAIRVLPINLSKAEIDFALKKVNSPKLDGKIRSTFVILSDDDYKRHPASKANKANNQPGSSSEIDSAPSSETNSAANRGQKRGPDGEPEEATNAKK